MNANGFRVIGPRFSDRFRHSRNLGFQSKKPCLIRGAVTLFILATLFLALDGFFGSPSALAQSPESVSIEVFPVGSTPYGLAFDGTNIWTTDFFGNAVIKVRASDGAILGSYGIFEPIFVACDGASVWVTNDVGDVTKFRGSDLRHEATIDLGSSQLGGIIFDGTNIWVAAYAVGDSVYKLRASDGEILGSYAVGRQPYQLAFDGANIWVTNSLDNTVSKLWASDGQLLFTVLAGIDPNGIVFDGREIWVANSYPGAGTPARTITKLRLTDGAILATARVGKNPQQLAFDGTHIWVSNWAPTNTVLRLRAGDGALQRTYRLGTDPGGILFDGTSIWIAYYNGTLCKITPISP
jgi:DNA-binding beta-propeller fold protein YncE